MAKTYTTVPTKTSGDTITVTNWTTHLQANINNLMSRPTARVERTTDHTISTGTITAMVFDTEAFDTDGMGDLGTNADRLTAQTAGVYLVTFDVQWASNSTGDRVAYIYVNNSAGDNYGQGAQAIAAGVHSQSVVAVVNLSATDYINPKVYQSSGGNLALDVVNGNPSAVLTATWLGRSA